MTVKFKILDQNMLFIDGTQPQRILDAWGPGVAKHIEDFISTPFASADNMAAYTTTLTESGSGETTVALTAGATGGALLITTDNAENDGANIQLQGEAFKPVSGLELYFGIKFQISSATESDFLFGLCITDTDVLGAVTDGVYFRKNDGTTTCNFVLEKNSTETSTTAVTIAAATDYTLEFYFDGTNVYFWVDGVLGEAPVTTNLPDDEWLTPTIAFLTGTTAAITCSVDWIRTLQINTA